MDKLLANSSVRESKYPQWVANVVIVKKKNGKWRMCVDFTDLNMACPKDSFPLPHIDQLIDAMTWHELLSFMDAYSGYNQILMEEEDEEKATFITHKGTYCYRVMPFRLKNAGATYQRLVTKMFKDHLGKIMEVYVDDMLVKSKSKEHHIDHLKEALDILRQYSMKLNPERCAFGVTSGRIAALSRFISRSSHRCHKFFNVLKKDNRFLWNSKCIEALRELKAYLSSPLLHAKAEPGKCL
uniref:RNA-directed DNA polymerase homolog n=1 Tax=Nicotiana tabacum TaxID=4097 RepID=A0A1S3ZU84_TOBAC|nr:PREDICTED: RNA-directed DNA polymerase homolog [Nicotiana tabacum]